MCSKLYLNLHFDVMTPYYPSMCNEMHLSLSIRRFLLSSDLSKTETTSCQQKVFLWHDWPFYLQLDQLSFIRTSKITIQ